MLTQEPRSIESLSIDLVSAYSNFLALIEAVSGRDNKILPSHLVQVNDNFNGQAYDDFLCNPFSPAVVTVGRVLRRGVGATDMYDSNMNGTNKQPSLSSHHNRHI